MFPHYWVLENRLMAGAYPGSPDPRHAEAKTAWLIAQGIRAVIDLTEEDEVSPLGPLAPYEKTLQRQAAREGAEISLFREPVPDLYVPTRAKMAAILDRLDAFAEEGKPAYVHCLGGRGRTGTVIACYLVRHAGGFLGTVDDTVARERALDRVVALRLAQGVPLAHDSPQTGAQYGFVRSWRVGA